MDSNSCINHIQQRLYLHTEITKRNLEKTSLLSYKIFQNLNEGIVVTDTQGVIQSVNDAYCTITGYSRNELIGHNPRIVKSNLHDESFYKEIWKSVKTNGKWKGQIWNRHKKGHLYLQKLYIIAIRDDRNKIIEYVGVSSDISEEEKLQKDIIQTGNLQRTLLPPFIKNNQIEVDSIYAPSEYLSGDFYDYFFDVDYGVLCGYMIDIMGHGITAAYQTSILRILFQQKMEAHNSLANVLNVINRETMQYFLEDTFAAALCFRLDMKKNSLTFSSAGINKLLKVHSDGQKEIIKQDGLYLGIIEDTPFKERTIPLKQGDSIYLLTDGLFDVFENYQPIKLSTDFKKNMNTFKEISAKGLKDDASAIGIYVKLTGG